MVGRILRRLKERGVLVEPPRMTVSARRRSYPRPYVVRKPKGYVARRPGDLLELDTLDLRPLPGVVLKHFTARDVVSRWDVLEVHSRATATTAGSFLDSLQKRMPLYSSRYMPDTSLTFQRKEEVCGIHGRVHVLARDRAPK